MQKFLLDANVFIEAKNRCYAFDLAPKFWDVLSADARIISIDRVKDELLHGNDDLASWVKAHFKDSIVSTDSTIIISRYRKIMEWVSGQAQFNDAAKSAFASGADGWLVACASVNGHTIVTHEIYNTNRKNAVPIPNVCKAFDVQHADTFTMLKTLGIKFS